MAGLQTVLTRRFDFAVRMMAIETFQRRHGPLRRDAFVTREASVHVNHLRGLLTVTVAL